MKFNEFTESIFTIFMFGQIQPVTAYITLVVIALLLMRGKNVRQIS